MKICGPKRRDFVEPPLEEKYRFDEDLDVIESLEQLNVIESSAVRESSEQLDMIESSEVRESSEQLDVIESSEVSESSEQLDVIESSEVRESSEQLDVIESGEVRESSEKLDVKSFISNNGKTGYLVRGNGEFVSLNSVRRKHLIICSVSLPSSCVEKGVPFWRVLTETYSDLCQSGFEVVVSVTVKENKKHLFEKLISKLPFLAIPFSDLDTRNSVCTFINTNYKSLYFDLSAIVVDPAGLILPYPQLPMLVQKYGFECLTRTVDDIEAEDDVLKIRLDRFYKKRWEHGSLVLPESIDTDVLDQPLSLHKDFLLCDPSCVLLTFDNQSLPVSELSKKFVALYLCVTGKFMEPLSEVCKQCLENNQELEVVLVCMPYFDESRFYYGNVFQMLKRYDLKSWFIFPFDNKVCFRLKRFFCSRYGVDKLIILPPNCKSSGEVEGRAVISSLFKGSCEKRTCLIRKGKQSKIRAKSWKVVSVPLE